MAGITLQRGFLSCFLEQEEKRAACCMLAEVRLPVCCLANAISLGSSWGRLTAHGIPEATSPLSGVGLCLIFLKQLFHCDLTWLWRYECQRPPLVSVEKRDLVTLLGSCLDPSGTLFPGSSCATFVR